MSAVVEQARVPELRFPGYTASWNSVSLEQCVKLRNGYAFNSSAYSENGEFQILTIAHVQDGCLKPVGCPRIREIPDDIRPHQVLRKGDLLISMTGNLGRVCYVNGTGFLLNQRVGLLEMKDDRSAGLLFHILRSSRFQKRMEALGQGGAQLNLSAGAILGYSFYIPRQGEQEKIAGFLTAVDDRIGKLKRKKGLLEEYKRGMMQKLFSQEVRFKDEYGRKYPDWEVKRGNEVFERINDKNHDSDLPILAISQEYGAIPREMIDYDISVSKESVASYKVVRPGNFIISLRSFQGGLEYSRYTGICSPAYIILNPVILINDWFFKAYFKTYPYILQLKSKLEGIRDGKMISFKYFSETRLPYPSLEEQERIAEFLTGLDEKLANLGQRIEKAEEFKRGLLQKMFV